VLATDVVAELVLRHPEALEVMGQTGGLHPVSEQKPRNDAEVVLRGQGQMELLVFVDAQVGVIQTRYFYKIDSGLYEWFRQSSRWR
jgi:hypothetical protein